MSVNRFKVEIKSCYTGVSALCIYLKIVSLIFFFPVSIVHEATDLRSGTVYPPGVLGAFSSLSQQWAVPLILDGVCLALKQGLRFPNT